VRFRLPALLAGLAFISAGCSSEPTVPNDRAAATDAAQTLLHLADSLAANGGSASEVGAYRGLASQLVGSGRLSSVTISVDGTPAEFLATAQELQVGGCPPGAMCTLMATLPIRWFSAWQKDHPRRMVQLFAPSGMPVAGDMPLYDGSTPVAALRGLLYLDGAGSMYGGATTSQSVSVTTSDTPCPTRDNPQPGVYPVWTCRLADFTVAFDGVATLMPLPEMEAVPLAASAASAAPSHHLAMSSQSVHGAHVDAPLQCIDCPPKPPGTTPPMMSPWRDSLTATLTATVGSDVTFTFTVKNTRSTPVEMKFNDGQQYDIRVWDANDALVWRWSADKLFTLALMSRTLAPGESVTYVEHWKPASAGSYHAMAYLTSSSHGAVAFANFSSP